jgi:hypothetical protein
MEGVNLFEGTPCPTCSAPLRVIDTGTATPCQTPAGVPVNSSNYECEGPDRHGFGTLCLQVQGKWGPPSLLPRKRPSIPPN